MIIYIIFDFKFLCESYCFTDPELWNFWQIISAHLTPKSKRQNIIICVCLMNLKHAPGLWSVPCCTSRWQQRQPFIFTLTVSSHISAKLLDNNRSFILMFVCHLSRCLNFSRQETELTWGLKASEEGESCKCHGTDRHANCCIVLKWHLPPYIIQKHKHLFYS